MNLYLIRHSRTDTIQNDNLIQSPETPLGEYGLNQAKNLAKKLKLVKLDHLYASDYTRAYQTATQISQSTSISITINRDVREKDKNPVLNGAPLDGEINLRFVKESEENINDFDWKFEGQGESFHDLQKRVQKVIDFLVSKHSQDSIAIVTHAYFIEMFLAITIMGKNTDEQVLANFMHSLSIHNASLTSLKYNSEKKIWKILSLNDFSHLEENWIETHNKLV